MLGWPEVASAFAPPAPVSSVVRVAQPGLSAATHAVAPGPRVRHHDDGLFGLPFSAAFAPVITVTKTDQIIGDDGDGLADPGETIRYTITIGNSGDMDATGVVFDDTFDPNTTFVTDSDNASPIAFDGSEVAAPSTTITITLVGSDADGDDLTFAIVTPPAGSLGPIMGNGSGQTATVEYTAPASGPSDSFTFSATDDSGFSNAQSNENATVTIALDEAPEVDTIDPADGAMGVATDTDITVTFTEPVNLVMGAITIECPSGNAIAFTNTTGTGPATTFVLDPDSDLPSNETCEVTVLAANVTDADTTDPPDNMEMDFTSTFTTDAAPTVTSTTPMDGATEVPVDSNIEIVFSEDVTVSGTGFTIDCTVSGPHTYTTTTSTAASKTMVTTYTLDPDTDFVLSETCTVTAIADDIADDDGGDPPDTLDGDGDGTSEGSPTDDYVFSFSTPDAPPTVTMTELQVGGTFGTATTDIDLDTDIRFTFSEDVNFGGGAFSVVCGTSGTVTSDYTASATPASTVTLTYSGGGLAGGETCTVTLESTAVTDDDGVDPPDDLDGDGSNDSTDGDADDFTFMFTTAAAAVADAYDATGNIGIEPDDTEGVLANDEGAGSVSMVQGNAANVGMRTATDATGLGGETGYVTVQADGSFLYEPPPGFTGNDTFTYEVSTAPPTAAAKVQATTATVTITVSDMVWFIDTEATSSNNTGTFQNPFTSLASFNAASGVASGHQDNHYVYLHEGTYTGSGLALRDGQQLYGDEVDFTTVFTAIAPLPSEYDDAMDGTKPDAVNVSSDSRPVIDLDGTTAPIRVADGVERGGPNAGKDRSIGSRAVVQGVNDGITLGEGNTIQGVNITDTPGGAGIVDDGSTIGTPSITDVSITGTGGAISFANGGNVGSVTFDDLSSTNAPAEGIFLSGITGTMTITASSGGIITPTNEAVEIVGGSVGFTFPGAITKSSGAGATVSVSGGHTGSLTFPGMINATSGTGIQFDNAVGTTYNFNGSTTLNGGDAGVDILNGSSASFTFGTLSITSPTGDAFHVNNSSGGITYTAGTITQASNASAIEFNGHSSGIVNIGAGVTINATNGDGLQFDNADGTYNFNGATTLNGGDAGIDIINGSAGTFTFSNTTITSPTGTALNIDGGSSTVNFNTAGSITQANNAAAVMVQGGHTGSLTYSRPVTATNGTGLQFNNADGTTYSFNNTVMLNGGDAGIDIINGSSALFTFSNTTITNPTGVAFNVDNSAGGITYTAGGITQTNAASAVRINGHSGGIVTITPNVTASTSTANAINLTGNSGAYNLNGILNLDTTTGIPFNATGGTVNAPNASNTIGDPTPVGATAVEINGITTTTGITFASIATTGSGSEGIDINDLDGAGTFSVTGTTTITNPAAEALEVTDSDADFSFGDVAINTRNTTGILIDDADGTTFTFGDVDIPNPNNATGYGIRIDNSAANFSFASADISDTNQGTATTDVGNDGIPDNDGDGDAIFLNSNIGDFTLLGGLIEDLDTDGIDLRNVSGDVTISGVTIDDIDETGASGNVNPTNDNGIFALNFSGTMLVKDGTISNFDTNGTVGDDDSGIKILNINTSFPEIRVDNVDFTNPGSSLGGNRGFEFTARGAVDGNVIVQNCVMSGLAGDGIGISNGNSSGSGTVDVTLANNTLQNSTLVGAFGGIQGGVIGTATMNLGIHGNTLDNLYPSNANNGMIGFTIQDDGNFFAVIDDNRIEDTDGRSGIYLSAGNAGDPSDDPDNFDVTISENEISNTDDDGVLIDVRGSALNAGNDGQIRLIDNFIGEGGTTQPVGNDGFEIGVTLRVRNDAGSPKTVDVLLDGNRIRNFSNSSGDETLDLDAEDNVTVNATITDNFFSSTTADPTHQVILDAEDAGVTLNVDFRNNTTSEGAGSGNGSALYDNSASATFNANTSGNNPNPTSVGAIGSIGSANLPSGTLIASAASVAQHTTVSTAFTALSVKARNNNGSDANGVTVTFTAPGAGASGTFPSGNTCVTNASGICSVPFTANGTNGAYEVTASATVTGGGVTEKFFMRNTPVGVVNLAQDIAPVPAETAPRLFEVAAANNPAPVAQVSEQMHSSMAAVAPSPVEAALPHLDATTSPDLAVQNVTVAPPSALIDMPGVDVTLPASNLAFEHVAPPAVLADLHAATPGLTDDVSETTIAAQVVPSHADKSVETSAYNPGRAVSRNAAPILLASSSNEAADVVTTRTDAPLPTMEDVKTAFPAAPRKAQGQLSCAAGSCSWNIGTLPAGRTVTILFDVTVNDPFPPGVPEVSNQGTLSSNELADIDSDDPDTGGGGADPTVTPVDNPVKVVINEIDYDQPTPPTSDSAEFIELKNVGTAAVDLSAFEVLLINGTGGGAVIYDTITLPNQILGVGEYYVICGNAANVDNCDLDVTSNTNLIQNGAPDAVALQTVGTTFIHDTVSYEGDTGAPYTEGSGTGLEDPGSGGSPGANDDKGISRLDGTGMDGVDTDMNNVDFSTRCITPGEANTTRTSNCSLPVFDVAKADVLLIDGDGDTVADPGETIRYTVTITNTGGDGLNTVFTDTPGINTALVVGSVTTTQGTVTTGNTGGDTSVEVDIGTVAGSGGTATITFDVTINDPVSAGTTQVCNQGTVSADGPVSADSNDPDTTDPDDPTCTDIEADPVVAAEKTDALLNDNDGNGVISPGDDIRYTITLTNSGNEDAGMVSFTDTPDANSMLVVGSVTTTQGTVTMGNTGGDTSVAVDVGTVAGGGGTATITFDVTINDPFPDIDPSQIANQGDVTGGNFADLVTDDPDTVDPDDPTVTEVITDPVISATKDDGIDSGTGGTASPGDVITYTVVISNEMGAGPAEDVVFTDTPDANSTLVAGSVTTTQGTVTTGNTGGDTDVEIDIGTLAGDASVTITFQVMVNQPFSVGATEISNQGFVNGSNFPTADLPTDDVETGGSCPPNDTTPCEPTVTPIDAEPLITATKDDGVALGDDVMPGDEITYTVTITNSGDRDADMVTFDDTVDPNTTLDCTTTPPTTSQGTITTCDEGTGTIAVDLGTLAGNDGTTDGVATITFVVTVDNPIPSGVTDVSNQGEVTASNFNGGTPVLTDDPDDATGDMDPTVTPIDAMSDVMAAKRDALFVDADNDGQADPGDTIRYTVTITNTGNQGVDGVSFSDTVDPNTTLDCSTATASQGTITTCDEVTGTIEVTGIGMIMGGGGAVTITFDVDVNDPFPGNVSEVRNQGFVSSDDFQDLPTFDPDTPSLSDATRTPIDVQVDLELTKTASTTTPDFGEEVVFTITVSSNGPADPAINTEVRDVLPKGLTFVSATGDGSYNAETGIWDTGGITIATPAVLMITARVDLLTPITNEAEILRANLPDPDSTPGDGQGDDYDAVTLTPVAADLELDKRLTSRIESADGLTVRATFTLTLHNDGPSAATGVEVMEFFAGEMTFVSADPAGAFNAVTGTWTVGTLAAGSSTTLSLTVTAPAEGPLFNLAEVSAVNETDPDSEPLDGQGDDFAGAALNRGEFEVPPLAADLSVTKAVDQAQPLVGEQVTYTITVSNAGPFTTAGVAVTDVLPEGVTFVSASASTDGGGCDPCTYDADSGVWSVGPLVDGETATLEIVVEVVAEGEIVNTASITSHHLPDPDSDISIDNPEEDDVASVAITVGSGKATSVVRSGGEGIPEAFEMSQNYPNPFNPQTTIPFGVPESGRVVVAVYNLLGQRVAVLMDREVAAGRHEVVWQALDQPTGMYLVRMVAGETTFTKRITLVK